MSSSTSGRGAQASTWDGESGYRVHVSDLAAGVSRKEIERVFTKFGPINEVWVATNPPCFAFVNFKHRSDADKAIREIDGKVIGSTRVGASWARTRTYGGRNRGGRGAPYGSYRSSAGSRRRSRSRSLSGSRHRRRRYSRSRSHSRDRHRRRSPSPHDRDRDHDRKRSRRSSNEKNENTERKEERRKSKTPRSVSRSRSHSKERSLPRQESPGDANRRNQSRESSIDDHQDNEQAGSPLAAGADENNTYDRSPVDPNID